MPATTGPAAALVTGSFLRGLGWADPDRWAAAIAPACDAHGVTTPLRIAALLANAATETGFGRTLVENLSYSPERLAAVWPKRFPTVEDARPFAWNPEKLAEKVYGGRLGNGVGNGDGFRYRGRGLMQTTGKANYTAFANTIGASLEALPGILEMKEGAADSAAMFFQTSRCFPPADAGNIEEVRTIVNGALTGIVEVRKNYRAARQALGIPV